MKISIITASYNCRSTIGQTIESVSSQGYGDIEHIIVDGASNDGTLEIIRKHARPRQGLQVVVVSEADDGVYDAMNKGISMASGDIIGFLNADDLYSDENVINDIVDVFRDPEVDGCYSDLVYVDRHDTGRVLRHWKSGLYENGCIQKGWIPPHPTFYVRKGVYDRLGGFNINFKLAADFELMLKYIEKYRIRIRYIPRVTVKMRYGGVTNRSIYNIIKQNVEIYKACNMNDISIAPLSFMISRFAARIRQRFSRAYP